MKKTAEDGDYMLKFIDGWFECIFFCIIYGENFDWKSANKIKPQSPKQNRVDKYGALELYHETFYGHNLRISVVS